MDEDPRAVLGVPAGATRAVLKRAFRARARATHPDHGGDRTAFEAAVTAYAALLTETFDDSLAPRRSPWLPYVQLRPPASTFTTYDSRRPTPQAPVSTPPCDDFGEVLARAMAGRAAA